MRSVCICTFLLALAAVDYALQQSEPAQPVQPPPLTVRSTLVTVPVLVTTKAGKVVFELTADDFVVTDNGVPQHVTLDQETDSQPLALAIVVETGGAGARHLDDYRQLDSILDALIGNVEHSVAVIGFDSTPHLLMPFSPRTSDVSKQLANLTEGDQWGGHSGCSGLRGRAVADAACELPARDSAAQRNHRPRQ